MLIDTQLILNNLRQYGTSNLNFKKMGWEPVVAAGIAATSQAANAYAQGRSNLRSRQFAEEMYFRQRADSLEDWNRVNAYNSPAEQMRRMKEAGINPHEAFGAKGNTADPVRSSQAQSWNPEAVNFDAGSISSAYLNTKMSQQQLDNLKKQADNMESQKALIDAQKLNVNANTEATTTDTNLKNLLQQYNLEAAQLGVQKTVQDIAAKSQTMGLELQANERAILNQVKDFELATEAILKSRSDRATSSKQREQIDAAIVGMKSDNRVKEYKARLADKNVNPDDPLYARMLASFLDYLMKKYMPDNKPGKANTPGEKFNPSRPKEGGYDSSGTFHMPAIR